MSSHYFFSLRTIKIVAAIAVGTATMNPLTAEDFIALLIPTAQATDVEVTDTGVGIGTITPQRSLHLKGNNAVFRMDRNVDGASFLLVRTNSAWNPIKTFQVGVTALGPNNGEFIINDLGQAVGGYGINRMRIANNGETTFSGRVVAPEFFQTSSSRFKEDIKTLDNSDEAISRLRGVRFTWKGTDRSSIGLIAEEVSTVYPELVEVSNGVATGVNYAGMVAVLVEAIKSKQTKLDALEERLAELEKILLSRTVNP